MIVSNTSTLVLLAKISLLEKFLEMSPNIVIPRQVEKEYSFHKESYYAKLIAKKVEEGKIKVEAVENAEFKELLEQFNLDIGEAATYALYKKKEYKAILTDDGELIKMCKLEQIPFLGALAIVLRLYEKNIITKSETIEKMEKLHEVGRYSKEIYEYFIKQVRGET